MFSGFQLNGHNHNILSERRVINTMAMTLKALRVNAGIDQETAASKLGIKARTLSSWENGKTFPNVPQIMKIEKLYNVNYNDIIFLPNMSD